MVVVVVGVVVVVFGLFGLFGMFGVVGGEGGGVIVSEVTVEFEESYNVVVPQSFPGFFLVCFVGGVSPPSSPFPSGPFSPPSAVFFSMGSEADRQSRRRISERPWPSSRCSAI